MYNPQHTSQPIWLLSVPIKWYMYNTYLISCNVHNGQSTKYENNVLRINASYITFKTFLLQENASTVHLNYKWQDFHQLGFRCNNQDLSSDLWLLGI
jgi:glutamate synthase domain-containing protein 1